MDSRQFNGGPDDLPYGHAHLRRGGPLETRCDWCGHYSQSPVDYARIWFFCSDQCRAVLAAQPKPTQIQDPPF